MTLALSFREAADLRICSLKDIEQIHFSILKKNCISVTKPWGLRSSAIRSTETPPPAKPNKTAEQLLKTHSLNGNTLSQALL